MKKQTVAILSLTSLMMFAMIVPQVLAYSYPLTLTSPNAQTYGEFGYSVSISGKYMVVGAPYEAGAGHAYVFDAKSGKLINMLTSPNAQTYGYFGYSVSISGKDVVVGAPYETSGGFSNAGHAYVFDAKSGKLINTLTSPNAQTYGWFGWSVSISGKDVVVSAFREDSGGVLDAGQAYVFDAKSGKLINTLTSPNAQTYGEFGWSVSISGKDVVVGAPYEAGAGHAYVFDAKSGKLINMLTSPNAQTYGDFGYSVSISGKDVVVSAPREDSGGVLDAGHAYVFK